MVTIHNITGYQGDYIQLTLNSAINLDGFETRGQVRASYGSTGVLLNLNPTISGDGTAGVILINISSASSANVPVNDYVYDIERYPLGTPDGNSIKLLAGKFTILPEVTR